ncbi:MAG: hypothetical protein L0Y50_13885 [Beijerinckiaceae bacterium]|nr:hypothetical protein [Beijerinckiaceae bacterium]
MKQLAFTSVCLPYVATGGRALDLPVRTAHVYKRRIIADTHGLVGGFARLRPLEDFV